MSTPKVCKIEIPSKPGVFALVDEEDYPWLIIHTWNFNKKNGVSSKRKDNGKTIYMHRLVTNCAPSLVVDHINGDRLNNLKANLRVCTRLGNNKNSKHHCDSKFKNKGVNFVPLKYKRKKRWSACIMANGNRKRLGYYLTEEEAAAAYKEASLKYHGEFSVFRGQLADK